ncbi:MAG: hypothetical protein INH37_04070, partial [Myxococcaceae bacterium]|nr:hypothetical protein [Myxococcaceae bacterium]
SQSKPLDPQQTWRLSLTQHVPLLATVVLEFEDVSGRVEQAPLGHGETYQVQGKRSVGVRCEPGPSTPREGSATLELTPAVGRAARLAVDPRLCLDFERARGLELDHLRAYRLALPDAGDASLGEGAPVLVAWRARLTEGAFTSGTLTPGATVHLSGAVFVEVGFYDDAPRDNHGAAAVTLDVVDAPPP